MLSVLVAVVGLPTTTLAQQQTDSSDPVSLFLKYGIAGLVIAALLTGLLWAKPAVDNLIKRAEKAEQQRDTLLAVYEEKILPRLASNDEVLSSMKPVLLDVVRVLENVRDQSLPPRRSSARRTAD